jgi:hypothetical protein
MKSIDRQPIGNTMKQSILTHALAFIVIAALSLTVSGCRLDDELADGYQFGDATRALIADTKAVMEAKNQYCAAFGDSFMRQAALAVIRAKLPFYPVDGICTKLPADALELAKLISTSRNAQP